MSNSDWINLEKIATFLQLFKNLTVKMLASSYSTVFIISPLFNIIIDYIAIQKKQLPYDYEKQQQQQKQNCFSIIQKQI